MKKILIPTDFSHVADNAVRYAMEMTRNMEVHYVFFHSGKEEKNKLQENIKELAPVVDLWPERVQYESQNMILSDETVKEIVKRHDIDLIIMGTHGEKAILSSKIFGSNAILIIESSGIPVLLVPPDYSFKDFSEIVYASDLVNLEKELDKLVPFAKMVKAKVEVVHVSPVFPDLADTEKMDVNGIIERVRNKQEFPEIKYFVEETREDNQIVKGIQEYIRHHEADMLVIFHLSRSWIDKIALPSTTVKEVRHLKLPIMVFPKEI